MKLIIDSNVLLDVLYAREPHFEKSLSVWRLCEAGKLQGFVSVLTFANIVYIMRKELDEEKIKDCWEKLSKIFVFVDLRVADIAMATERKGKDFEDELQMVAAKRVEADYIITRNIKDFRDSSIPALTPSEFMDSVAKRL